eukprot:3174746-Rhodomonas_salina.1
MRGGRETRCAVLRGGLETETCCVVLRGGNRNTANTLCGTERGRGVTLEQCAGGDGGMDGRKAVGWPILLRDARY